MLFSVKSITIFTLLLITLFKWVDSRSAPSSSTTSTTTSSSTSKSSTESEDSTTTTTTTATPDGSSQTSTSFPSSPSSPLSPSTKESQTSRIKIFRRSTNWNFSSSSPAANRPPISLKFIIQLFGGILFSITLLCMCCCLNFRDKRVPGYLGSGASIRGYRSGTMRRGTQQA